MLKYFIELMGTHSHFLDYQESAPIWHRANGNLFSFKAKHTHPTRSVSRCEHVGSRFYLAPTVKMTACAPPVQDPYPYSLFPGSTWLPEVRPGNLCCDKWKDRCPSRMETDSSGAVLMNLQLGSSFLSPPGAFVKINGKTVVFLVWRQRTQQPSW